VLLKLGLAVFVLRLSAQSPGAQVANFHSDIDDSNQPYALYVPRHLVPGIRYPLVIGLHAEESNDRLMLRQLFGRGFIGAETEGEFARRFPNFPDVPYIIACPSARGAMGYQGIAEQDIYDMLADIKRRLPIDDDRIFLTGISTGGSGALWLGLTRPDLWAAIAPVSADPLPGIEPLAGNALHLPVELFHGEQDPLVPPAWPRQLLKRFLTLGVPAEYIEYPLIRHNAWEPAYRNGALFGLFAKYKRERFPDRVRFSTAAYKYDAAYWVRIDRLTPGTLATLDARFTALNQVDIGTTALDAFTLTLAGHPKYARTAPLVVTVDGVALHPKAKDTISFHRAKNVWTSTAAPPAPGAKRPGLEGPMSEAIAARHIYVYGTADNPAGEILKARREQAATAAQWSTPRGRLQLTFAVKADRDVTDTDIASANLILFGKRDTNSLIARFAGQLPMELNPSAADYGLVFVAPIGQHYLLIDSGLPWWRGADQVKPSGWRLTPAPYHVLEGFGDFILFKGSLEHVVAEGRFDSNWKLPDPAARQMLATGAVSIPSCCPKNSAVTATK
jgi:predicted esterase